MKKKIVSIIIVIVLISISLIGGLILFNIFNRNHSTVNVTVLWGDPDDTGYLENQFH